MRPEEYDEFYRHISRDCNAQLTRMSFKAEGRWDYSSKTAATRYRGTLGSKGVVDAADLPLNVSRQILQDAHHLSNIRKWLTRKVLDSLNKAA